MAKRVLINGTSKDAIENYRNIAGSMSDIKLHYIQLGYHLQQCKNAKFYCEFGFETFEEFISVKFGLDKSTASRCINVSSHYCIKNGGNIEVADKFKAYSYSQLVEMLPLFDEGYVDRVDPKMTVKDIRELKKSLLSPKKEVVVEAEKTDTKTVDAVETAKTNAKAVENVDIETEVATSQPVKIDVEKAEVFSLNNKLYGFMGHDEFIAHMKHIVSTFNFVKRNASENDFDTYKDCMYQLDVVLKALYGALDK